MLLSVGFFFTVYKGCCGITWALRKLLWNRYCLFACIKTRVKEVTWEEGRTAQQLEYIKAEQMVCWFKEIKEHTSRPARWILINLPYINCMLSGITELNAKHKCSFCLGEWNKKLLRISTGSHRCSMMLQLWVLWIHSNVPTPQEPSKEILFNYVQYSQIRVPWHLRWSSRGMLRSLSDSFGQMDFTSKSHFCQL